jgi:alanine racemase
VHSFEEGAYLKDLDFTPEILIVGYVPEEQLKKALDRGFHMVVYNLETLKALAAIAGDNKARVHLKLETGTNRQGISEKDLPVFLEIVKTSDRIELSGVSTHYANIEDTTDHTYAASQLDRYRKMLKHIEQQGFDIPLKHTASSAASLLFSETHFNLIRFGISLYGLWPSKETYLSYRLAGGENHLLKPALTWKAKISQVKHVPAGAFIGYGCTYRTTADSKIAILPIGYFDGYDRKLSNLGYVLIHGQRAPVRGRVCMDIFMVDVTSIMDVKVGDEAVLLGRQGDETISAEQFASWAQTINYEIIARINPLLPRIIV